MKNKIGKKPLIVLAVLLASVLLSAGILAIIAFTNLAATGNVLGVDWYNQKDKEFVITTKEELYEFAALSSYYDFKGQTIKLGADITVNEGNADEWQEAAPKNKWTGIKGFAGTFDGQGHTISGLYASGYNSTIGLFTGVKTSALVKDTKLTNSYLESRGFGGVSSFATGGGGNFEKLYSDAKINVIGAYSGYAGGICSKLNAISNIDECWYEGTITTTGRVTGGILDDINGATATVSHSLFSGTIQSSYDHSGAIAGGIVGKSTTEGASLIIEDSLSAGTITTGHEDTTGSVFGGAASGTSFRSINTYGADTFPGIGLNGVNGAVYILPIQVKPENMVGYEAYKWMDLDFEKYWCVVEDGTPRLQYFTDAKPSVKGIEREFDVAWYTEGGTDNVIMDKKQLRGFYILSGRTNFENTTIKLGADIVVNEGNAKDWKKTAPAEEWYQVDGFSGVFDGQGHSISGIYMNNESRYNGFFKTTRNATVKNFLLKNSIVINMNGGDLSTGSISGNASGTFENIYSDAIMELSGFMAGGLFGQVYEASTIKGCWYDGEMTSLGRYSGGIIGSVTGARIKVEHCLNSGTVNMTWPPGFTNSGGIVGSTFYDKGLRVQITDCLNVGRVVSEQEGLGSVLGHCVDGIVTIKDTYALDGSNELDGKSVGYNQATVNGGGVNIPKELLTGKNAYVWTTLDFDKHWAAIENGTPIPRYFAENPLSTAGLEKAFDISWYDAKAESYVIRTAKELYGLCIASGLTDFTDKTVKLGADIVLNTGNAADWINNAPAKMWIPLEKFAGTFDGQGHTISGMYIKKTTRATGMFGTTTETAVVKNFSLKNSLVKVSGDGMLSAGSIAGIAHGTFDKIYSNAIVDAYGTDFGGMFGQVYRKTNISQCWFDGVVQAREFGRYGGGVVGVVTGSQVNISHCLNTGTINIYSNEKIKGMVNCGGILGSCYYGTDIVINITDCFNAGTLKAPYDGMGSILGHCVDGVVNIKNTYSTKESVYVAGEALDNKAIGWNQDTINGNVGKLPTEMLLGTDAYKALNLDFGNYWAAMSGDTPKLKAFSGSGLNTTGVAKLYDTSWYSDSKKTFTLTTKEQLYGLSMISSYDAVPGLNYDYFRGKTVKLGKDIALNSGNATDWLTKAPANAWNPIMDFGGTLDGQGHTISGLYVDKNERYSGFFGFTLKESVVKNLSLKNSLITNHMAGMMSTGSIAGAGHGTFENIYSNAIVDAKGTDLGGMIGQIYENTTISNCWFDGLVQCKEFGRYIGGVVGIVTGETANIKHCLNTGTIEILANKDNPGMVNSGGILGSCYYDKDLVVNIKDCFNAGKIIAPFDGTGSIVGHVVDGTVNVDNCYATSESNTVDGKAIGWVQGTLNGNVSQLPEAMLLGIDAYKATYLDFDKYWAAVENKTPQLKSFTKNALNTAGVEKLYDTRWYDESVAEYHIDTKEELFGLALLTGSTNFEGKTIYLDADITLNEGKASSWATKAPAVVWNPIEEFAGTLDGQGHKISGVYTEGNSEKTGFFKTLAGTAEVRNLGIVNSYIKSNDKDHLGALAGHSYAKLIKNVYSDAILDGGNLTGGLVGTVEPAAAGAECAFEQCWYDGQIYITGYGGAGGGLVGYLWDSASGKIRFTDCLFSGNLSEQGTYSWPNYGGILGSSHDTGLKTAIVFENCLNVGTMSSTHSTGGFGGVLGYACYWLLDVKMTNTYAVESSAYATRLAGDTNQAITNTNSAIVARDTLVCEKEADLLAKLPKLAGQTESPWMCDPEIDDIGRGTPILKGFAKYWESKQVKTYDTSWYDENATEYTIDSKEDLNGFVRLVAKNNFQGKTIKLGADIVLNEGKAADWASKAPETAWNPIAQFAGTLDGQGHTISGVYINGTGQMTGFFKTLTGTAQVLNLGIVNSYIKSNNNDYAGALAGQSYAKLIKNVYSDAIIDGGNCTGGLIGLLQPAASGAECAFEQCWFDGQIDITGYGGSGGGLVGYLWDDLSGKVRFTDCLFSGNLVERGTYSWPNYGGILGSTHDAGKTSVITFENCLNVGTMSSTHSTGGFGAMMGYACRWLLTVNMTNCYAVESSAYSTRLAGDTNQSITNSNSAVVARNTLVFANETDLLAKLPILTGQTETAWKCNEGSTPILKGFATFWLNKKAAENK